MCVPSAASNLKSEGIQHVVITQSGTPDCCKVPLKNDQLVKKTVQN